MILMPTKFQNHCCIDCSSNEKQCGVSEKVLALAPTVLIRCDLGKGPFLSSHVPTHKMGWLAKRVSESNSSLPCWGFRNGQQATEAVDKMVSFLNPSSQP